MRSYYYCDEHWALSRHWYLNCSTRSYPWSYYYYFNGRRLPEKLTPHSVTSWNWGFLRVRRCTTLLIRLLIRWSNAGMTPGSLFISEIGVGRTEGETSDWGAGFIWGITKCSTGGSSTCLTGLRSKTGTTLSLGEGGKNVSLFRLEKRHPPLYLLGAILD